MNKGILAMIILSIFMLTTDLVCGYFVMGDAVIAAARSRYVYYTLATILVSSATMIYLYMKCKKQQKLS